MKHLRLVLTLLLLGAGFTAGPAAGQLTAYQEVPSPAAVGESVMVTVMLTYSGVNSMQAEVTPGSIPAGVVTDAQGDLSAYLNPGVTAPISYSIRAEQSGTYWIVSQITYSEDGTRRMLRLESPFMAVGQAEPEPRPAPSPESMPGPGGEGEVPGGEPASGETFPEPAGESTPPEPPMNGSPHGDMPPDGPSPF